MPPNLNTAEVCAELRLSRQTVSRLVRDGLLRAHRLSPHGPMTFTRPDVEAFLAAHRTKESKP